MDTPSLPRHSANSDLWFVVALAYLVLFTVLDLTTGEQFAAVFLVAPLIACTTNSPKRTGIVVGLMLAAIVASRIKAGTLTDPISILRASLWVAGGVFCVVAAGWREHREHAFTQVARVAEVAQLAILHPIPRQIGPISFAVRYLSAAEEASVGGDLYEVVTTQYGTRAIVGDVRGKGLDAVRLAAVMLGAFRESAATKDNLADVGRQIDERLQEYLEEEDFVTAVMIEFRQDGRVNMVNCGHHPPLRISGELQEFLAVTTTSPPFGLDPTFQVTECKLDKGDRVLLYTDGLVEARSPRGQFLEIDELHNALVSSSLDEALERSINQAIVHTGGQLNDDLAMLLAELQVDQAPTPV